MVDDVDLGLADADGLEQDVVEAGRVHDQRRLQGRLGEPAERTTARHRADEHALVEEVLGEADPVPEQGSARERARRVDREHADAPLAAAQLLDERADHRALADAGRAGEADDPRLAGPGVELGDELGPGRVSVLDQRDRPGEGTLVAGEEPLDEVARCRARTHRAADHATTEPMIPSGGRRSLDRAARRAPRAATGSPGSAPRDRAGTASRCCDSLAAHGMLTPKYAALALRFLRRRLLTVAGRRWRTDGMLFLGPRLQLQIGRNGQIRFGRFVWIGHGTKIRCHEGQVEIGAKTVLGQECTISAYQRVRIGEQCVIADRVMFIDFDHNVADTEQADPQPGHLQARRRRRLQRLDRLRSADPPRRHCRRQRDHRRQLGRHPRHPGQCGRRRHPGAGVRMRRRTGAPPVAGSGRARGLRPGRPAVTVQRSI